MDDIGKRMAIQNSAEIRREPQSASDLPQTSEKDPGVRHLRCWRQVLGITRITDDRAGRDPA